MHILFEIDSNQVFCPWVLRIGMGSVHTLSAATAKTSSNIATIQLHLLNQVQPDIYL